MLWAVECASCPTAGNNTLSCLLCLLQMRSSIPGLGRVMVFLAAALASASFAIPEDWGEEGVQYGQLGTDVTLSCPGVPASSPVQWRRAGATALPEGSAIQQGSLVLPRASLAFVGTYSCHGEDGGLLHTVSLRLGHLPGVPFVSCRASDYENFSCSWTSSVETFLPTRYITTYRKKSLTGEEKRRNKNGHVGLCLQDPSRPGTCTVHRSEFWSSYRLNITEVNPLGFSYRLLDVTMQAIIKPDPPEGLVVEPIPLAPRRLHVSWKYPSSWPKEPHFQLRFRLQYRPVIHRSWSVVETVNLSEVITDAFTGLEHVVQVSAKDFLDAGNWSEWSAEARATPVRGERGTESTAAYHIIPFLPKVPLNCLSSVPSPWHSFSQFQPERVSTPGPLKVGRQSCRRTKRSPCQSAAVLMPFGDCPLQDFQSTISPSVVPSGSWDSKAQRCPSMLLSVGPRGAAYAFGKCFHPFCSSRLGLHSK
uniref:Interleukin-11 receptor subunit alpha n=1 Tax=Catharus ustulatus TaxID=91951 RepID=A0A8C3UFX8_CATUS